MGASNTIFVGGLLLAVTVLTGASAHAMEPARVPSGKPSSAFSLPSFFDGNRVPDLKEAWPVGGDIAPAISSTVPAESAPSAPPSSDDATLAAAKAATVRAEQAGRDAAAVRRKAEELSRRFGADIAPASTTESATVGATETAPGNASGPASAAVADTTTGSVTPAVPLPPPSALGVPPPAEPVVESAATAPATSEPAEPASTAAATPELHAKKQAVSGAGAPAPDRRKMAAPVVPVRPSNPSNKTATGDALPVSAPGMKTTPGPTSKADAIPSSIGAFGWGSQPQ